MAYFCVQMDIMKNLEQKHRKSIRLKGYDYSQEGVYYVTLCTQDKECLFGVCADGEVRLNAAGKMVEYWYYEVEKRFKDYACLEMIIMPNHIHFMLQNLGTSSRINPMLSNVPLSDVIRWFKIMTTRGYIGLVKSGKCKPFRGKLWQRNYYEHIVRNGLSYQSICDYIMTNPIRWGNI